MGTKLCRTLKVSRRGASCAILLIVVLLTVSALGGCSKVKNGADTGVAAPAAGGGVLTVKPGGEITLPAGSHDPKPSPSGEWFVYYLPGDGVACLADRDGELRERLPGDGHLGPVSWSSNGECLAYFTCPAGGRDRERGRVILCNAYSGVTTELAVDSVEFGGLDPLIRVNNDNDTRDATVRLYAADRIYEADPDLQGFLPSGNLPGRREGPFDVSWGGLVARPGGSGATGLVEVLDAGKRINRVNVQGTVAELALNPLGTRLAILCSLGGGWQLHAASIEKGAKTALLDSGTGTARFLAWSPDGRFVAFLADLPGGTEARFIDTLTGAKAGFAEGGASSLAWADPMNVMVFVGDAASTRAPLLAVGDPPRVTNIRAFEWRKGRSESPGTLTLANGEFTVCRDGVTVVVNFDRLVTVGMIRRLLSSEPGPLPVVSHDARDGDCSLRLDFDDNPPPGQTAHVGLSTVPGGEKAGFTIRRLPEPKVTIRSLDRPELLATEWAGDVYATYSSYYTLGLGTKRFLIDFSQPMDRWSVERQLRWRLSGADRVDFNWTSDVNLELAITCEHEANDLSITLENAQSLDGVTVWMQPVFPYQARNP